MTTFTFIEFSPYAIFRPRMVALRCDANARNFPRLDRVLAGQSILGIYQIEAATLPEAMDGLADFTPIWRRGGERIPAHWATAA